MTHNRFDKNIFAYIPAVLVWLVIWQIASTLTGLDIILPGPVKVLFCMAGMLGQKNTYIITMHSLIRIFAGYTAAFVTAVLAGLAAGYVRAVRIMSAPLISAMQALPVTAFIILVLMIAGAKNVSAVIAFIVVFPVIYHGMVQGIDNMDKNLAQMADVFNIHGMRRFRYISLMQCMPYIRTAVKSSAGMCWKAGAAAEVIGLTRNSIGEQMYLAKLYLETDVLLSWGIIIIIASVVFEKLLLLISDAAAKSCCRYGMSCRSHVPADNYGGHNSRPGAADIELNDVSAGYGLENVINGISVNIPPGGHLCIMGESGIGKTTLLKVIAGLLECHKGSVIVPQKISVVFQEDRLCPWLSAYDNVRLAVPDMPADVVRSHLGMLLGESGCDRRADELSGGMKRRCEIVRAMLADSDAVVMDEPFAGLDEDNRCIAVKYILDNIGSRQLIVSTHDLKDAVRLQADAFFIDKNGNG